MMRATNGTGGTSTTATATTTRLAAAILAALLPIGGLALAAPPAAGGPPPGQGDGIGGPPNQAEMREAMEQLMIVRMKRVLRLTPQQESRVVPRMQALLDARREFAARRRPLLSHLRALASDETADEKQIDKALRDLHTMDAQFRERQQGLRDAINAELTARQQARLFFFEERFRKGIQKRLQAAMRPGPPRGGGRGAGANAGPRPEPPSDGGDGLDDDE